MLGGVAGARRTFKSGCTLVVRTLRLRRSRPRRPIPINRFPPRHHSHRSATMCIWRRCTRRRSRRRDEILPNLRLTRPIPSRPRCRRSKNDPLTRDSCSPLIPDPSRKVGKQTRCFLHVRQRSSRRDDGRAVPRPHVNETTCVFRLFAIGVAQNQCAPVQVERERVIAERGCYGARRSKASNCGLTGVRAPRIRQ